MCFLWICWSSVSFFFQRSKCQTLRNQSPILKLTWNLVWALPSKLFIFSFGISILFFFLFFFFSQQSTCFIPFFTFIDQNSNNIRVSVKLCEKKKKAEILYFIYLRKGIPHILHICAFCTFDKFHCVVYCQMLCSVSARDQSSFSKIMKYLHNLRRKKSVNHT